MTEIEASPASAWKVDGTGVLARSGVTLPRLDLESGVDDGEMKPVARVPEPNIVLILLTMVFIVAGYLLVKPYFSGSSPGFFVALFLTALVLGRVRALRGHQTQRMPIWTFVEDRRAKRMKWRRSIRICTMLLIALALLGLPLLLVGNTNDLIMWLSRLFGVGVPLLFGLIVWAVLDREKLKVRAGPPGWIRIDGVDHGALAKLREMEREARERAISDPPARKRLVRTSYFHRYPLSILIGRNWKRPLLVLNIVLMKLLKSRLLERELYHFSEAEEIPPDQLGEALGKFANDWLSSFPGWTLVSAKHLPSPAGDLVMDTAILASPGFEHCMTVNHVLLTRNPGKGTMETTFLTWIEDERVISTVNQPSLKLGIPRVSGFRASGSPAQVFATHLKHCEGHKLSAAGDASQLTGRILRLMEEVEVLLIKAGLQSELREAD